MENTLSLLPEHNPDFASLPMDERISIVESTIGSFEVLAKKRQMAAERIERSELNDELELYWTAWKSNFRTRGAPDFF